jgi:hypothetical protein
MAAQIISKQIIKKQPANSLNIEACMRQMFTVEIDTSEYDLIGIKEITGTSSYYECKTTHYHVYLSCTEGTIKKNYLIEFNNHSGDCSSGYCCASTFTMSDIMLYDGLIENMDYVLETPSKVHLTKNMCKYPYTCTCYHEKGGCINYSLMAGDKPLIQCSIYGNSNWHYSEGYAALNTYNLTTADSIDDELTMKE